MTSPEELNPILERIVKHQHTESDISLLRQWLSNGSQIVSQQGKYAVNLGQGQEIHIGDRIYQGTDAETIRQIVRNIVQELQQSTSTEPKSLGAELITTLNNAKFQGKEGEQGGTGSFYHYEIYLDALRLENEQNKDNYQEYALSGNWSSFVYKYVYVFNKVVDTPWGHNKKPYGRFQVVVKSINGVVEGIRVKADRYNDNANNYAANKVEQLIESKIKEITRKN
ncbi:hypothetical protein H6G80_35070 [Nostoc sp. FACHB-87]|uniref:hypothetical protein n=1 Tax=Nostocales TaxID=1161 RepID=UPI00168A1CD2|nr:MULTISPECIES: hypothetical protein [Nostocales]MBD2459246.1 hypothetical protein [Nostoc sp. FACHB-87]MBD2480249.1 hypothetical protein [Anabaena sp. FACHB-83]MBD2490429.1 hypothetical protein [Aulosira sp. FACHB-615]